MKVKGYVYIVSGVLILISILLLVFKCFVAKHMRSEEDGIKYLIGVSQYNLVEPWRIAVNQDIEKSSKGKEHMRVIYTDATGNDQEQILDIKELMSQGIDALIVSPGHSESIDQILKEVKDEIPVILIGRQITSHHFNAYIGPDNEEIGKQAALAMAELFKDRVANIVEIKGNQESLATEQRSKAFNKLLNSYGKINVVDTVYADWMRDKAEDQIKKIIMHHNNIDGIFAHNDEMAYGAYIAADMFRKEGIKFVGAGGLEGLEGGKKLVEDGILHCTLSYETGGNLALQYALQLLKDENVPPISKLNVHKIEK